MQRILIQIYAENKAEAFEFYKNAFYAKPGYSEVAPDGTVVHAELDICGFSLAVGEIYFGGKAASGNTMQFCLQFEPGEEHIIARAYDAMKENGKVLRPLGDSFFSSYMTDIIDRYGVHWCLFIGGTGQYDVQKP